MALAPAAVLVRAAAVALDPATGRALVPAKAAAPAAEYSTSAAVFLRHAQIYAPEPEFSEEARKAKYQGVCTLGLIVGADGRPSNIRVLSSLGMGLDEKAIEAVKNWKFEPAMKDGHPVRVEIAVEVDFHLY